MKDEPEIGGAQALLSLGTSEQPGSSEVAHTETDQESSGAKTHSEAPQETKNERKSLEVEPNQDSAENIAAEGGPDASDVSTHAETSAHTDENPAQIDSNEGGNPESNDYIDKASQSLNDAVEAAVMRYVGGTLDTGEGIDGHGGAQSDTDGPLDEEFARKRARSHAEDLLTEYQWDKFLEEEVAAGFERSSPKKKPRKNYPSNDEIDPDLDELDDHAEHDQLVHAAILGAGELAKQLTLPGSSQHRHQSHMPSANDRRSLPSQDEHDSTAINHLAHAARALSGGYKPGTRAGARRNTKESSSFSQNDEAAPAESKYTSTTLESLIEEASSEACSWYNMQSDVGERGPRLFSEVEIGIVEHFLRGYCRLNHLSRMDICRRVWTTERPRDNFWESVTKVLPYRSKASVYKHIRRQYHVFQVRAKWTPAEDDLLRKLTETTTTNWKEIGEAMDRMPEDCRDRWRNYIKCGDNRVMNKWSLQEEQSLKNIVMDMITSETQVDKPILINWTVVSERMNGRRSRIQCRYKWNKLLRRESLSRVTMMDNSIKLWMLNRILESNVTDIDSIDWDYIVHMYHEMHKEKHKILWTTADFKVAFEKMRGSAREYKNLSLHSTVTKLIDSLYQTNVQDENPSASTSHTPKPISSYEELRPKPYDQHRSAEHEAASVANAAVAAVSSTVSAHDAQHQEYSLWR
ncbi:hypothetical protein OXX80_006726 [Metschnikowia pulcherrima]